MPPPLSTPGCLSNQRLNRWYCTKSFDSITLYGRRPGGGMADAEDLKSSGDFSSCGFDSHPGHHHFSFNKAILSPLLLIWSSIVVLESDSHQCLQQPACLPQVLRPLNFPYLSARRNRLRKKA